MPADCPPLNAQQLFPLPAQEKRGLTPDTLRKYRVGASTEQFLTETEDEEGGGEDASACCFPCVAIRMSSASCAHCFVVIFSGRAAVHLTKCCVAARSASPSVLDLSMLLVPHNGAAPVLPSVADSHAEAGARWLPHKVVVFPWAWPAGPDGDRQIELHPIPAESASRFILRACCSLHQPLPRSKVMPFSCLPSLLVLSSHIVLLPLTRF